ncbi:hypothetical protein JCM19233_371 [Vibrio astriarenae]|nr:hypothetical protein JCM19233_371 [Vibrio sp. C7]
MHLPSGDLRNKRVLVVDDIETNRDLMAQILERWKIPHKLASSGKEALAMMREAEHKAVRSILRFLITKCQS